MKLKGCGMVLIYAVKVVAKWLSLQVMKFAIATRVKAMAFLSSVAIVGGLDHPQDVMEDEVGTQLCTEHPGDGGYAVGCAPSCHAPDYCHILVRVDCHTTQIYG